MPEDPRRSRIMRGMRLEGGIYPADDPRKDRVKKGAFLTGDPRPGNFVKGMPPASLAATIAEMVQRLQQVRKTLEAPLPRKR